MSVHWTLADIPWDRFDAAKVNPEIAKIVRAAALVEYGGNHYADYLCNIFSDDEALCDIIRQWALEEVQHGQALAKWASLADPEYNLESRYATFRKNYSLDTTQQTSVRGSRAGELLARCMVETGTSSYYTAMREQTDEPVLQEICQHIAADELRHYKLFYDHLKRYLETEPMTTLQRLRVALGRIAESDDDELASAYFAANGDGQMYNRTTFSRAYARRAFGLYRRHNVERVVGMVFKACGLKPQTLLFRGVARVAWWGIENKAKRLEKQAA
jgi:rubrerythrin